MGLHGGSLTSHMDGYEPIEATSSVTTTKSRGDDFESIPSNYKNLSSVWNTFCIGIQLTHPEHGLFLASILTLLLTSAIQLTTPHLTSHVIDAAVHDHTTPTVPLLTLFGSMAVASFLTYGRNTWQTKAAHQFTARLRQNAFASLLGQEAAYYDTVIIGGGAGGWVQSLSQDTQTLQVALSNQFLGWLRNLVMTLGAAGMLFSIAPSLALLALGILPPALIGTQRLSRVMQQQNNRILSLHSCALQQATQALQTLTTVQQYTAERIELDRYAQLVQGAHDEAVRAACRHYGQTSGMELWGNGAMMIVLGYGGHLVALGVLRPGSLAAFGMYALILAGNVSGVSHAYLEFTHALAALDRIVQVLDREPSIPSALQTKHHHHRSPAWTKEKGGLPISFQNVEFSYPARPSVTVLKDFSWKIAAGETVALVGSSGAGKSTLAALLTRLYSPTRGTIRINGMDIGTLAPYDVRSSIGVVSQDPVVFPNRSIADNIRYGCPSATHEQVHAAAVQAHVWEFAQHLPEQMDTVVGGGSPNMTQLSGGQKQRIAIARCLLKDPAILILDEATSALDGASEHVVQQALHQIQDSERKHRTILIIAHRLSSIQMADRVAVLEGGAIVQSGTYQELLKEKKGAFQQLIVQSQE